MKELCKSCDNFIKSLMGGEGTCDFDCIHNIDLPDDNFKPKKESSESLRLEVIRHEANNKELYDIIKSLKLIQYEKNQEIKRLQETVSNFKSVILQLKYTPDEDESCDTK